MSTPFHAVAPPEFKSPEIVSTRVFAAPREAAFHAFSDPAQLVHWWGPHCFTNTFQAFDFRAGGIWEFTMHGPDGADYPNRKDFSEIVENERIVFHHLQPMHVFTMTMLFADEAGGTRLTWIMQFTTPDESGQLKDFITAANGENFDRQQALALRRGLLTSNSIQSKIMKHLPAIAGVLLGLMFLAFGAMFLLDLIPKDAQPPPEPGSAAALFMGAFAPTGYLHFVKVLDVLGGLLVAIPKTRNISLLVLSPIIVNILAFHIFITAGKDLFSPILIILCLLAFYLLWVGRKAFAGLASSLAMLPGQLPAFHAERIHPDVVSWRGDSAIPS